MNWQKKHEMWQFDFMNWQESGMKWKGGSENLAYSTTFHAANGEYSHQLWAITKDDVFLRIFAPS